MQRIRQVMRAALLALLALWGCGGGETAPTTTLPRAAIQSVSITPSGSLSLGVGDTLRFSATVSTAAGAPAPVVTWRVSPSGLASVSADGLLTSLAPGTFSLLAIAATPARGAFRADSMAGTVLVNSQPLALTSLDVQPGILTTPVGGIVQFDPQVVKASPAVQVTWTYQIQQPLLGSIDVNGVITTYFAGTTSVRLTATGSAPGYQTTSLVATRTLNIVPAPSLTFFDMPTNLTVPVGGTVRIPLTVVVPRNAPYPAISVADFPPGPVTVAGSDSVWTVTGVRPGTQNLTFRAVAQAVAGYFGITRTVGTTVTVVP
ncbi:MAG: Ig-like domain-containing protein [Gemmatimonadaceae bacterium]|nr:Ig-like domain-containing protein [Gemmatimonadaceae bacterium]